MGNFRFGVFGAANIAVKFCEAVRLLPEAEVVAVASKSMERAKHFAEENKLAGSYDSYEELLVREKPDAVYIAVTTNAHFELTVLCLKHSIPVLCEKAMFLSVAEANVVYELAREKGLFVMEATWSRFLPAVRKVKQWLDEGRLGRVDWEDLRIGWKVPYDPKNRFFAKELGGGAALDLGIYAIEITTFLFGAPRSISADAVFGETGVDVTDHWLFGYTDFFASLSATFMTGYHEGLFLYGEKGRIVMPNSHYASEAFLYDADGKEVEHFQDTETKNGFVYEAAEVIRCVKAGLLESPVVPWDCTMQSTEAIEMVLQED